MMARTGKQRAARSAQQSATQKPRDHWRPTAIVWVCWAFAVVAAAGAHIALVFDTEIEGFLAATFFPLIVSGLLATSLADPTRGPHWLQTGVRERVALGLGKKQWTPTERLGLDEWGTAMATTFAVSLAASGLFGLVSAIVRNDFTSGFWLTALLAFSFVSAAGLISGLVLYLFPGILIISLVTGLIAARRGERVNTTRIGVGAVMVLAVVLTLSALRAVPERWNDLETIDVLYGVARFSGPPDVLIWAWVARAALILIVACVIWLNIVAARLRREAEDEAEGAAEDEGADGAAAERTAPPA
jgi:hypothetical protein